MFGDDAKDVIRQLLNPDQDQRLGCTDLPGVQGLYAHPFFEVGPSLGACLCVCLFSVVQDVCLLCTLYIPGHSQSELLFVCLEQ
jgi:hypothetical protein